MNRTTLLAIATVGLAAGATISSGQYSSNLGIGATVGLYFPSTTKVRQALGDSLFNYGIGGTGTNRPSQGSLTPDLAFTYGSSNGNHLFLGNFTEGYEYNLAGTTKSLVPYIRPFAGLTYFDFGITEGANRIGEKRIGYTYGVEVGAVISQKIRLAAAYNLYSGESGFSFNGISLMLSYSFM